MVMGRTQMILKATGLALVFAWHFGCSSDDLNKDGNDNIEIGENDAAVNTKNIGKNLSSKDAFALTVHPLTKKHCGACHGEETSPLFAGQDVEVSHNALVENKKVNFGKPADSRIVLRLREDSHNCWGDCKENADALEAAIVEWKDKTKDGETQGPAERKALGLSDATADSPCNKSETGGGTTQGDASIISVANATLSGWTLENSGDMAIVESTGAQQSQEASFTFDVADTEQYTFYIYAAIPQANNMDSYFISLNDGAFTRFNTNQNNNQFGWQQITLDAANMGQRNPLVEQLTAGTHTIKVRNREAGPRFSGISIKRANDAAPTETPQGGGGSAGSGPQTAYLCYDVSDISGSEGTYFGFKIEVFGATESAYKVSQPVLIAPKDGLKVKDVDILVNGEFVPQYNAYKLVDETVTEGKHLLSEGTIIMGVEEGTDKDKFSVSFGELSFE